MTRLLRGASIVPSTLVPKLTRQYHHRKTGVEPIIQYSVRPFVSMVEFLRIFVDVGNRPLGGLLQC